MFESLYFHCVQSCWCSVMHSQIQMDSDLLLYLNCSCLFALFELSVTPRYLQKSAKWQGSRRPPIGVVIQFNSLISINAQKIQVVIMTYITVQAIQYGHTKRLLENINRNSQEQWLRSLKRSLKIKLVRKNNLTREW